MKGVTKGNIKKYALNEFLTEYKELNTDNKYRPVAVGRYGIRKRESIYSKELAKDYSKNKLIHKGTLTVGMGSKQIDIGILIEDEIFAVSPAYHTYEIQGIRCKYLEYCLRSKNIEMFSLYAKRGSRQGKSIDLKRWLTYKIPVYSEKDQIVIEENLNKINYVIELRRKQIDLLDELVKARFIGIEISNPNELKIKYYISQSKKTVDLSDLLYYLMNYKQYKINAENLIKSLPDISIYKCSLIQLSSGYTNEGECINMYFEKNQNNKKIFYSIKEGIVLRDVGGVVFLIDIHEKYYYDYKNLFSVNDIGKVIIKFALNNKVFTIEAVVSYLKSIIKDYHPEMYSLIYSDCQKFINELLDLGYVEEIK